MVQNVHGEESETKKGLKDWQKKGRNEGFRWLFKIKQNKKNKQNTWYTLYEK